MQYEISFHRSMHMAACGCVQVQPSRGRKKKNGWKNTHSCEPPDNFFCRKFRQCHSVRTPRHLATVNPQRGIALLWVVWTGEFGLVSPPEWSWTGTKFLFGHSQRLVGETEGSSCLSECFFFFLHIFQKLCSQYIAKGLGFVRPICIQAVLLGCARSRALPVR